MKKIKQNSIRKQARTQASSLIGPRNLPDSMRLEQHSSAELGRNSNEAVLGVGQNTSSYETGRMVSGVSEGNCDALKWRNYSTYNLCIFSYLQNYLWWFFTSFINNFE